MIPTLLAPIDRYSLDPSIAFLKNCQRCKLHPGVNPECLQIVPGSGNLQAQILLLAEAPSTVEVQYGHALIGPSYEIIRWLEKIYRFDPLKDFYISNALMCKTPGNRTPTSGELNQCRKNLDEIIRRMPNLKLVVTLGATALKQIEGEDSVLSLRQGCLGHRDYVFNDKSLPPKDIFTLALKHPAYLMYIENERGKQKAIADYISQLEFLRQVYDRLDNLHFEPPYQYEILDTEEKVFDFLSFLRSDKIEHITVDVESGAIWCGWAEIVCMSVSWGDYKAKVIPVRQSVGRDVGLKVKAKRGRKTYTINNQLIPYFDSVKDSKSYIERLRPELQLTFDAKMNSAWNRRMEYLSFKNSLQVDFLPRPEQIYDLDKPVDLSIPPPDVMEYFRLTNNDLNSLALAKVIGWCAPLEADMKDPIQNVLSAPEIQETGFSLMAIKPDGIPIEQIKEWGAKYNYYLEEMKAWTAFNKKRKKGEKVPKPECPLSSSIVEMLDKHWCPEINMTRWEALTKRCAFDADMERRLVRRGAELMLNEEQMSVKSVLPKEIFI